MWPAIDVPLPLPSETYEGIVLECRGISKTFRRHGPGILKGTQIRALDNVSLTIGCRSITAIAGESGAGKTTLARCLAQLEQPDSGRIWIGGRELTGIHRRTNRTRRRDVQLVFQSSAAAMNPRWTVMEVLEEPLRIASQFSRKERRERCSRMLEMVGVDPAFSTLRPQELSGGQRQRLAIARALMTTPRIVILDEALAGLDLLVRAQIIEMLLQLQPTLGLSYIFITHDLRLAVSLGGNLVIMRDGRIVEAGAALELFQHAQNPHTQELVAEVLRAEANVHA